MVKFRAVDPIGLAYRQLRQQERVLISWPEKGTLNTMNVPKHTTLDMSTE